MATIRLIPSTYYLSNPYLTVRNAANMYTNTDSDTYATVTNTDTRTHSYYIYLRGFNFDDIPSTAVINSFSIKLKANARYIDTSTSYSPKLCNGTSEIISHCSQLTTTVTTYTFVGYNVDLDDIKSYGDNFGIRINCRKASANTRSYVYIHGAEIEVDYTIPEPPTSNKIYIKVKDVWTEADTIFVKDNGTWQEVNATWLKENGSWVQQDKSGIFDSRRRFKAYDPFNGHDYVDLGLPSGTLWATMNVGANSPTDYGNYYAWGEVETKSDYSRTAYKWHDGNNYTKYTTSSSVLELEDDAARVNWGGGWYMPTRTQLVELYNNCTWVYTTQNGINGYVISGNGNSIFLPFAGYINTSVPIRTNQYGHYWSSVLYSSGTANAYMFDLDESTHSTGYNYRYYGRSIRPVITP